MKVLFLGRKKDYYSLELLKFLKKKKIKVTKILMDKPKQIQIKPRIYDYIISFRSYIILKKKNLSKIKYASLNFHPGPPNYRGIGCANFAIYNQEKFYGVTAHLINEKIDNGKIIDVKYFKLKKNIDINSLLRISYKHQLNQAKKVLSKIFSKNENLKKMIHFNRKIIWSKKLYLRKELNDLYKIKKNVKKNKLDRIIRATNYKNFKPYLILEGKKFYLDEKKNNNF